MIDWHAIGTQELQALAQIATQYDMGIAAMLRRMDVLSEAEQATVAGILRQGVGNGESSQQIQRQIQLHAKGADA